MATSEEALMLPAEQRKSVLLSPVLDVNTAMQRLAELQAFVKQYMVIDEDYGTMPGTNKRVLFKPGADKLCEIYGFVDTYEMTLRVEEWDKTPPLFDYEFKCTLTLRGDGSLAATGVGSCNSWEGKYKWREAKRQCPDCSKETIIKGKSEYGGGWLCHKKQGGCGAKFGDNDTAITAQIVGRIENDDVATIKNTILKMAKKRAKIDAVIAATRSSGLFTQDINDYDDPTGETEKSEKPDVVDASVVEATSDDLKIVASDEAWAAILAAGQPNGWLTFDIYKYAANRFGYTAETVREHVTVAEARELWTHVHANKLEKG